MKLRSGRHSSSADPHWLSRQPNKRAVEIFNLAFSCVWISVFGVVVASGAYLNWGDLGFMLIGLFFALPYVLVPLLAPGLVGESRIPLWRRYSLVSNVWIAVFSYVGNYFWTHYFYDLLGASYSFPATIELNEVPFFLYLMTHGYFSFYHVLTSCLLRRWYSSYFYATVPTKWLASALLVVIMAVATAFLETFTISSVPYYSHTDKFGMYTIGSVVYAIYFVISFPMFFRVMEYGAHHGRWTVRRALVDSLAACMSVTICLDLWRLFLGGIKDTAGLPWLY